MQYLQCFAFRQIGYADILDYFEFTIMTWNEETRILKADPGKWITNGETYAIEAKLAPGDDVSNWWEVDELPPIPEPENKKENGTENENDYLANEYLNTEPEE